MKKMKNNDNRHSEDNAARNEAAQEPNDKVQEDTTAAEEQETAEENPAEESSEDEIAKLKEQVEKEKKEYLFLLAEFDNFRKRTLKEKSDIIRNANEQAMKGLLPIVDDFERGLEATKGVDDPQAIREGMEIIYNKFVKFLEQNGVKAMESTGAEFNPDMHEAIAMVPVDDQNLKGKVIDTPTKGYMINDKVLRHAKVAVGQ